jgi:hypothetical protein
MTSQVGGGGGGGVPALMLCDADDVMYVAQTHRAVCCVVSVVTIDHADVQHNTSFSRTHRRECDLSRLELSIRNGQCTYAVTGQELRLQVCLCYVWVRVRSLTSAPPYQFFFTCETCQLDASVNGGLCVACAHRCHAEHKLSLPVCACVCA